MEGDKAPECHVCEGVEYYLQAGFYYCKECHTQSLGYRESYLDTQENTINIKSQRISVHAKQPKPKRVKQFDGREVHWTSWEGHNFVLKGLVDELISLGARPELKTVALQLWAKYLGKLEVAFTSKTQQLLPKFGLNQTPKDYMVIYGQVKERTKKLQSMLLENKSKQKSMEKLSPDAGKNSFRIAKKLCVTAEYEKIKAEMASSQDILSQIDERLKLMAAAKKPKKKPNVATNAQRVQYNNRAQIVLETLKAKQNRRKEFEDSDEEDLDKMKEEEEKQMKLDKSYLMFSSCFDAMYLTRQKVLALLVLSLWLTKDKIQISDLLRWIKEGHVSYNIVSHFFPEGVRFSESDVAFIRNPSHVRYRSLESCVADVASLLEVSEFPVPDYAGLARRYASELELPAGLAHLAERLMVACGVRGCEGPVSHEATVMAFIVVTLKTLLGLDGRTEHRISDVAGRINSLMDADAEGRLFVWDEWVRYVICRRSVIMSEHCPTRYACDNQLDTGADSYVDWFRKHEDKDPDIDAKKDRRASRFNAHNKRIAEMNMTVDSLVDRSDDEVRRQFPPSLTPQSSYLQAIRSQWSADGSIHPTEILSYAHSLTDVDYLVQPERVIEFARSKGVSVVVQETSATQEIELIRCSRRGAILIPNSKGREVVVEIEEIPLPKPKRTQGQNNKKVTKKRKPALGSASNNKTVIYGDSSRRCRRRKRSHSPISSIGGQLYDRWDCSSTSLTLYAPFMEYWIYKVHSRQADAYFETTVEADFPDSFRWLLTECSRLLEMSTFDLYTQVRLVEDLCSKTIKVSDLKLVCPKLINIDA